MEEKINPEDLQWYVIHTYSGYENKVKEDIENTARQMGLQDLIAEVKYPTEEVEEIKDGKRRHIQRKVFPGYVMVKMFVTDQTWYLVRNTRGVTGFVGSGTKPIPLTDYEVAQMGVERRPVYIDIEVGEKVRISDGPFEKFIGVVEEIDQEKQVIRLYVDMFGKKTPLELGFFQVEKI